MPSEWEKHSMRWGEARHPLAEGVLPVGARSSSVDGIRATEWKKQCPRRELFIFQVVVVRPAPKDAVRSRSALAAEP
jgi:hypothetical protein